MKKVLLMIAAIPAFALAQCAEHQDAKVGDVFSVVREISGGIGYTWQPEVSDPGVVQFVGMEKQPSQTMIMGGAEKANFNFKAKSAGYTMIKFTKIFRGQATNEVNCVVVSVE